MSEWQPIETAPKDGTQVLIHDPRAELAPVQIAQFYNGHWLNELGRACYVTHWQPLPTPPSPFDALIAALPDRLPSS